MPFSIDRRLKDAVLKAGFAIVSIDDRLAPETKPPEIIRGVEDGYAWLHKNGRKLLGVDTRKIGNVELNGLVFASQVWF